MMVVFVIAFIIVPFFRKNSLARPGASKKTIDELVLFRSEHNLTPEDLFLSLLNNNDITFIGEPGKYHETTGYVTGMIPRIRETGVTCLGVSFLNSDDQASIDRLIASSSFDEELAKELLFNNLVMNGYREYLDMIRAVWESNQSSREEEPLRLIGLSPEQDWSAIRTGRDADDPAVIRQVYARGVPDSFMARAIEDEILKPGHRGVIYAGFQNTLATLQVESYQEKMTENGFPDDIQRAAWYIRQLPGVKSSTLFLHAPWTVEKSRYGIDYPLGGVLDSLMDRYEGPDRSFGFYTAGTPFGDLPTAPGSLGTKNSLRLSEFCDAYVLLGPLGEYTPFSPVPGFINAGNFDRAVENFPGPKESMARTPGEFNEFIAGTAANITHILEKFKK